MNEEICPFTRRLEQFALAFPTIPCAHLRKSPALRAAPFGKGGFRGLLPAANHTDGKVLVHANENRSSPLFLQAPAF